MTTTTEVLPPSAVTSLIVPGMPVTSLPMEHAAVTDWDTMCEQLTAGQVPYLTRGTRDPTHCLYWMLVGFDVEEEDYPAGTQHFEMGEPDYFGANTQQMATKCQLCLQAVLHTW